MAKKSVLQRGKKRAFLCYFYRQRRDELRKLRNDKSLSISERLKIQEKLNAAGRDRASVRMHNRCSITGRPRGYYRRFGVSRIQLRVMAGWGLLPGLVKASW